MPDIEMPNGDIVNFPDDMPKEQIRGMIASKFPEVAPQGEQKEGLGRTAFDQGMQGATLGFADEVTDRIGAFLAATYDTNPAGGNYPEQFKQNYSGYLDEARNLTSERQKRQFEQNPVVSIGSNVAGGLLTGGAGASTKAGALAGNFIRTGNLPARIAKGAVAGAASGAAYGAGTAEDGERIDGAGQGAVLGGVAGAALPAIGAAVSKANTRTVIPGSEQIRERGSRYFKRAEEYGGEISAEQANKFYNKILRIRPQTEEGAVFRGESPVSKVLDRVPELLNKPMSLRAAMEIDEQLGEMAYSTMDSFGKISKEGKRFLDMQGALRSMIDDADESMVLGGKEGFESLKQARKYWSASLRMREIERIIEKAESREQPVTALKNGFSALLNRGDKLKGYTPAEVKAIRKAARTGIVTDLFKLGGSGLIPIGAGVTGAAGGPVGGAMGYATGFAAQQGSKAIAGARQMGRANNALKEVAKTSGLLKTEQRIPIDKLRAIMKLPPNEARLALEKLNQQ